MSFRKINRQPSNDLKYLTVNRQRDHPIETLLKITLEQNFVTRTILFQISLREGSDWSTSACGVATLGEIERRSPESF